MPNASPVAETQAGSAAEAAALIAEAREHARRRRRRIAVATVIVAALIGAGVAWTGAFSPSRSTAQGSPGRPDSPGTRTGRVTGYIAPCAGAPTTRMPYAAGTVTARRGRQTSVADGPGTYRLRLPASVAARQHVRENQAFSFDLPSGQYVLVARYDSANILSFVDVTVAAGRVLHQNFPDMCK